MCFLGTAIYAVGEVEQRLPYGVRKRYRPIINEGYSCHTPALRLTVISCYSENISQEALPLNFEQRKTLGSLRLVEDIWSF